MEYLLAAKRNIFHWKDIVVLVIDLGPTIPTTETYSPGSMSKACCTCVRLGACSVQVKLSAVLCVSNSSSGTVRQRRSQLASLSFLNMISSGFHEWLSGSKQKVESH